MTQTQLDQSRARVGYSVKPVKAVNALGLLYHSYPSFLNFPLIPLQIRKISQLFKIMIIQLSLFFVLLVLCIRPNFGFSFKSKTTLCQEKPYEIPQRQFPKRVLKKKKKVQQHNKPSQNCRQAVQHAIQPPIPSKIVQRDLPKNSRQPWQTETTILRQIDPSLQLAEANRRYPHYEQHRQVWPEVYSKTATYRLPMPIIIPIIPISTPHPVVYRPIDLPIVYQPVNQPIMQQEQPIQNDIQIQQETAQPEFHSGFQREIEQPVRDMEPEENIRPHINMETEMNKGPELEPVGNMEQEINIETQRVEYPSVGMTIEEIRAQRQQLRRKILMKRLRTQQGSNIVKGVRNYIVGRFFKKIQEQRRPNKKRRNKRKKQIGKRNLITLQRRKMRNLKEWRKLRPLPKFENLPIVSLPLPIPTVVSQTFMVTQTDSTMQQISQLMFKMNIMEEEQEAASRKNVVRHAARPQQQTHLTALEKKKRKTIQKELSKQQRMSGETFVLQ